MTHHPHCSGPLQWARINCALKRSVAACPHDSSDAHHLQCPVINLGIRRPRKKERKNPLSLCFGYCSPLVQWDLNSCTQLELKRSCAICISRGLIWQRVRYLTLSQLLFATNYVVMISQYWSWNHFHHQWISRQKKKLQMICIPV